MQFFTAHTKTLKMAKERLQRNLDSLRTLSKSKRKNRNYLISAGNGDIWLCVFATVQIIF